MHLEGVEEQWPEIKEHQWELLPTRQCTWLSITLKLKPNPELIEKLDKVYLLVSELKYCANKDGKIDREQTTSLGHKDIHPFVLHKQNNYEYCLPATFDANGCRDVSTHVQLVFLKRTLTIIDEVKVPPSSLQKDIRNLLTFTTQKENNAFTDIEITVSGEHEGASPLHVFAHKAILATRSPVFAKMFEHDLQESTTNSVTVSDIEPEVFKELLTYVYTDRAPNIKKFARSLLYAAEKYQLVRLKALCEQNLSYGLQLSNAAETLVTAKTYGAEQLKANALKYIIKHRNEVRETKDWEKVHERCDLLEELLDTALEQIPAKK